MTRNTIPWRLECELEGLDRDFGLKQYGLAMEQDKVIGDTLDMNALTAYSTIGFFTFAVCCMGGIASCIGGSTTIIVPLVLTACVRLTVIIMSSIVLANLTSVDDITVRNIHKLEANSNVDCSDEFSRVDIGPAMDQMDESNALLNSAIACIVVTYLWLVLECCCACGCACAAKGACRDCRIRLDCYDFKEEAKYFFLYIKLFN